MREHLRKIFPGLVGASFVAAGILTPEPLWFIPAFLCLPWIGNAA